ncbi:MAG: hypothetical protein U9R23_01045 [Candidatus Cloacimonadota bacterium]|nr:hypothetical protein [Candidatus Cloacimonadota bacterium]
MGRKQDVIIEIFKICKLKSNFVFDNGLVKQVCKKYGFGNPFDVTKLDDTSKFPRILLDEDYFILHLGKGRHKFIKGIKNGFHLFEAISKDNIFDWKYRKSLLNEFDKSESNILSVASNQRIIHDFLYEDIVANPKVYNARRTKIGLSYCVGNEEIMAQSLQMEIDLTMELGGVITIFEGKNGFPDNFAVYQLFHPFKYYSILKKEKKLDIKQITCCYVLRKKEKGSSIFRLYNYSFADENNIGSIKFLRNAQYNLIKRYL